MLRLAPDRFAWRDPPYEYEHDKMPIDILAGSPALKEQIGQQTPLEEIVASWCPGVAEFAEIRRNDPHDQARGLERVADRRIVLPITILVRLRAGEGT